MSDQHDYDDHLDGDECWNCGGEGRVNTCIDGCCVDQDDIYCEYCSKRCDVCSTDDQPKHWHPDLRDMEEDPSSLTSQKLGDAGS